MERVNHSYKEFSFIVKTIVVSEGYNIRFDFDSDITDPQINSLIATGKAVFAYHIQCAQTCYRAVFETNERKFVKFIKEECLNGLVEVCPFIIAKEDIKGFYSENFSQDYMGIRFDIDKGGILAIGDQSQHNISKDINDINNTSSIFMVTINPEKNAENMSVDIRDNKIYVVLPEEQYGVYKSISKNSTIQKTMHAMIFVPALMYVLSELEKQLLSSNDFGIYADCRWTLSLCNVAEQRFGKTLEDLITNKDTLELAQMLLKNPMNDALNYLGVN
jgi:hypothetical protein